VRPVPELQVVIFSKDRPAQLELLLRSVARFWRGWEAQRFVVLYAASNGAFARGYEITRTLHPRIAMTDEAATGRPFREQALGLLGHEPPYTAFLVDDNVFKEPFGLDVPEFARFASDPEIAALSLRMAPHMSYCYPADLATPAPAFEDATVWRWPDLEGDWGYPMSLDGHLFRTHEILPRVRALSFANPNTLEGALAQRPLRAPKLICLEAAPVLNVPANRVQTTNQNRHAGGSAARVNRMFVRDARLDLEPLVGMKTRSPHHPVTLRWQGVRWRIRGTESPRQRAGRVVSRIIGIARG
jgi:hypothetical protein